MFTFHYRFVRKVFFLVFFILLTHSVIYLLCKREDYLKKSSSNTDIDFEHMALNTPLKGPDVFYNRSTDTKSPRKKKDLKDVNDSLKDVKLIRHRLDLNQDKSIVNNYAMDSKRKKMAVNEENGKEIIHDELLKPKKLDRELKKEELFDMTMDNETVENKLREMGGVLLKKRPLEAYAGVTLPPFIDSGDRFSLGK